MPRAPTTCYHVVKIRISPDLLSLESMFFPLHHTDQKLHCSKYSNIAGRFFCCLRHKGSPINLISALLIKIWPSQVQNYPTNSSNTLHKTDQGNPQWKWQKTKCSFSNPCKLQSINLLAFLGMTDYDFFFY